MCQGIDNRVDDRLWRADRGRFTYALCSDGVVWRRRNGPVDLPVRRLHRGGHQVVLEVAALDIAQLVVGEFLVERRCQSLRQAAVYLPLDHHWIDNGAA